MAAISIVNNQSGYRHTTTYALPYSVTNGSTLVWGVAQLKESSACPAAAPTKSSGTATIGTVTLDATYSWSTSTHYFRNELYRIPITGDGTLTIAVNNTEASYLFACIETLNINAIDGTQYTNTASSTAESSGNMTGHAGGLMVEIGAEFITTPTHSAPSDQMIYYQDSSTYMTGQCQYRLCSAETVAITSTLANSGPWGVLGIVYKPVDVTAALTGTATSSITEADVVTGGKTIIITLTGATWVAN